MALLLAGQALRGGNHEHAPLYRDLAGARECYLTGLLPLPAPVGKTAPHQTRPVPEDGLQLMTLFPNRNTNPWRCRP